MWCFIISKSFLALKFVHMKWICMIIIDTSIEIVTIIGVYCIVALSSWTNSISNTFAQVNLLKVIFPNILNDCNINRFLSGCFILMEIWLYILKSWIIVHSSLTLGGCNGHIDRQIFQGKYWPSQYFSIYLCCFWSQLPPKRFSIFPIIPTSTIIVL